MAGYKRAEGRTTGMVTAALPRRVDRAVLSRDPSVSVARDAAGPVAREATASVGREATTSVGFVLQSAPDLTGGGPLAILVTFLLAAVFYAVTLHLAATFFVGDVPSQRAATVAPVPAAVSLLLQQWGPLVVIPVTLLGDGLAIAHVYDLDRRPATALTLLHFAFATVLGLALVNLFGVA